MAHIPIRRRGAAILVLLAALIFLTVAPSAGASTLPSNWYTGGILDSWWHNEWQSTSTHTSIAALSQTHSKDAMFIATWYMASPTASTVARSATQTPDDAGLLRAMAYAKSLGMRVELKLGVDVAGGGWRGQIAPADVGSWFESYNAMISHYAMLAQKAGASVLVLGAELDSMVRYTPQWRTVIATARSRYAGALTYGANWVSGADQVHFWDALDYIGVDAYMPLATPADPNPTVAQLDASWAPYVTELGQLVTHYRKPAIFTEIGYQSVTGTAVTPWSTPTGSVSQTDQANAYQSAYAVWSKVPWFHGIFWWDWRPSSFSVTDGQYSPRGKLAAGVMTAWNG